MKQDDEQTEQTPLLKEEKEKEKEEKEQKDEKKKDVKGKKDAKGKDEKKPAKKKKSAFQNAKDEGFLLERPFGILSEDNMDILPEEEPSAWSCIATTEPLTQSYRAGNPTPLMLLLIHLGNSVMALLQLFGAWSFLTINAELVFPKCGDKRPSWMCQFTSIAFWTFPLVAGLFVPFFHYWDVSDTRLFYEGLRNKLLVHFTQVPFITNACIVYLIVHFLVGCMMFFFTAARSTSELIEMLKAVLPYFIPILTFFIQTFVTWDIKFFLITLAKYTDEDPAWSKKYLMSCVSASEGVVMKAVENIGRGRLPTDCSNKLFSAVQEEVQKMKDKSDADVEDGKPPQVFEETEEALPWPRIKALLFYQEGFWTLDLLWLPKDLRGSQFRLSFRIFAVAVYLIEALLLFVIACTVITYLSMQGHHIPDSQKEIFSLKPFMLNH
eukprot:gnl/TRDRNA2_/TRDRNA2_130461_c0_seq1.p1 gnl/TRDRNA2_/TRDRNA2_130461_c0~~gnl/TRDRNA2_/TRDRNA2_130461_c0_seq1.p1  ORF type:complete len:437 (-),score=122.59 gnl/TRDRNA2_/TRDRNA2_130461_c0_seq1:203-1513(-)